MRFHIGAVRRRPKSGYIYGAYDYDGRRHYRNALSIILTSRAGTNRD